MVMTRPTAHGVLIFVVMAGLFATFTAARAEAQRFGRPPQPRAGACFCRDADVRGDYFCVRSGDAIDELPNDLNDQISSGPGPRLRPRLQERGAHRPPCLSRHPESRAR